MRVDAAVRYESEEVNVSPSFPRALEGAAKRGVLVERAVRDGQIDAHEVLEQDTTRADGEVADLRVAHLPVGKPDGAPGGGKGRAWEPFPQVVEDRRVGELDGVAGPGRGDSPAVEDDERYEREAAIRHRFEKDAGSSEAPPTRAPSIEGRDRSSAAFSGFTEPP